MPINEAVTTPTVTKPTKIVDTALISGVTPSLTIEYILIGSVVEPGPEVKLAITRSSRDKVNANSQPDTIAGKMIGNVINMKVRKGVQPKSRAASVILSS